MILSLSANYQTEKVFIPSALAPPEVVNETVYFPTPQTNYLTETINPATPSPEVLTETIRVAPPTTKVLTETIRAAPPASKVLTEKVYIPQPAVIRQKSAEVSKKIVKKTVVVRTTDPPKAPIDSSSTTTTKITTVQQQPASLSAQNTSVTIAKEAKNNDFNVSDTGAANIYKKCLSDWRTILGLLVVIALAASILVPLLYSIETATTTSTTTTTTSTSTTSTATTTTETTTTTTDTTATTATTTTTTITTTTTTETTTSVTTESTTVTTATTTTTESTTSTTSTTTTTTTSTTTTSTTTTTTTTETTTSATTTTTTSSFELPVEKLATDVLISEIEANWVLCYNDTYNVVLNSTVLDEIQENCTRKNLLLACGLVNSTTFIVAAMGLRTDVFYNCGTTVSCTHIANGVGWYYSSNYSWGFVLGSDSVHRSTCDLDQSSSGNSNGKYRLCWHTGPELGDYRCGNHVNLNDDENYVRYIYHVD